MVTIELSVPYAFLAGILTSFTPCVYPLIPITLALFGASEERSRIRSFCLSATYVFGIALTYTFLGMLSALSGAVFGDFLSNIYVLSAITVLLLYLFFVTLDLTSIPLLTGVQAKASKIGGKGPFGALLMGLVSGVVAAPCIGPVLAEILLFAAKTQDVFRGGLLLFFYALGFGMIFLLIGTFADLTKHIPKAGNWLYVIKFVIATSILLVIAFLWKPFIEGPIHYLLSHFSHAALLASFAFVCIVSIWSSIREKRALSVFFAFCVATLSFHLIFPPNTSTLQTSSTQVTSNPVWLPTSEQALEQAKQAGKIAMIDMYADWCLACKELEEITFKNPDVLERISKFVKARIDYEEERELVKRYSVIGLPCVLFIDTDGNEIPGSRVSGFLEPEEFIEVLNGAGL